MTWLRKCDSCDVHFEERDLARWAILIHITFWDKLAKALQLAKRTNKHVLWFKLEGEKGSCSTSLSKGKVVWPCNNINGMPNSKLLCAALMGHCGD